MSNILQWFEVVSNRFWKCIHTDSSTNITYYTYLHSRRAQCWCFSRVAGKNHQRASGTFQRPFSWFKYFRITRAPGIIHLKGCFSFGRVVENSFKLPPKQSVLSNKSLVRFYPFPLTLPFKTHPNLKATTKVPHGTSHCHHAHPCAPTTIPVETRRFTPPLASAATCVRKAKCSGA